MSYALGTRKINMAITIKRDRNGMITCASNIASDADSHFDSTIKSNSIASVIVMVMTILVLVRVILIVRCRIDIHRNISIHSNITQCETYFSIYYEYYQ